MIGKKILQTAILFAVFIVIKYNVFDDFVEEIIYTISLMHERITIWQ